MVTDGDDAAECAALAFASLDPDASSEDLGCHAALTLLKVVRAALAPWALGERDPVRKRVETRRGSGA